MGRAADQVEAGEVLVGSLQQAAAGAGQRGPRNGTEGGARLALGVLRGPHHPPEQALAQTEPGGVDVVEHRVREAVGEARLRPGRAEGPRGRGEDDALVPLRVERRVVGAQYLHGRPVRERCRTAEHRGELGGRVGGVHDGAVRHTGGAGAAQGEQDADPAGDGVRGVRARGGGGAGAPGGEQPGVRRADHEVGLQPGAVGQLHAVGATALGRHPLDPGVETELDPPLQAAPVHRVGQRPDAAPDVPDAEGLLHVRQHGRPGRGLGGVEAEPQGVLVEQRGQARVAAELVLRDVGERPGRAAQAGQATARGSRVRVGAQRLGGGGEGLLQQRAAGGLPDGAAAVHHGAPALAGARAEGGVQRLGDAAPGGVGQQQTGAVREQVPALRVHRGEPDQLLQRLLAGLQREVAVDGGQREQARAGVEGEAVPLVAADHAAVRGRGLADRHPVPDGGQPGGCRQPAHSRADDDDPCHGT